MYLHGSSACACHQVVGQLVSFQHQVVEIVKMREDRDRSALLFLSNPGTHVHSRYNVVLVVELAYHRAIARPCAKLRFLASKVNVTSHLCS